ncbi:glutamine synthetase [Paraburkholderia sp. Cpub6]|uniref:glutamine synthetase n=1 Tax=Paraburkholderia sp. Cpub6 TaxID=2723094 RepID=UPI0021A844CE|nr:glutamine synthetase [Paraburkholderia sp. Cpub6]
MPARQSVRTASTYKRLNLMHHYLGGLQKYSKDITLFLAPHLNSYKRFQIGTFPPTKVARSQDNRTVGFRLYGDGSDAVRVECRIGGADLNPYLAFAALIAAGLAGIDEKLALPDPLVGDAYRDADLSEIPKTLRDATDISSTFCPLADGTDRATSSAAALSGT